MRKLLGAMFVFGFIVIANVKPAQAQEMGAAQKVQWDITKETTMKIDQETVWELLSNLKHIGSYTKDFIKSVEVKGTSLPFDRILTFTDGTTRSEQIEQIERQHKFISYKISAQSLPKGLKDVTIGIFTKAKGESTEVSWLALIEGEKDAKKAFIAQLTAEFEKYASGMTNLLNNSVPAAKMN